MADITRALVEQAIAKDRRAVHVLVATLAPIVQSRAARVLLVRGAARACSVREEVRDMSQHVFALLFANEGRILRQWDPERGMSLANFVGLIAEHEVTAVVRSRRKSPLTEVPVPDDELEEGEDSTRGPERVAASREILTAVLEAIRAQLSDLGLQLFELLFVQGRSVQEVCAATGKSEDAVYAWRSRLGRLAAKAAEKLMSDGRGGSGTRGGAQ